MMGTTGAMLFAPLFCCTEKTALRAEDPKAYDDGAGREDESPGESEDAEGVIRMKTRHYGKAAVLLCMILACCLLFSACGKAKTLLNTWEAFGGMVNLIFRPDGTYTASNYALTEPAGRCEARNRFTYDDSTFTIVYVNEEINREIHRCYSYLLEDGGDILTILTYTDTTYRNGVFEAASDEPEEMNAVFHRKR